MPAHLLALVSMILNGPNIEAQADLQTSQHTLSISEWMYNSMIRSRKKTRLLLHQNTVMIEKHLCLSNLALWSIQKHANGN